MRSEEDNKINNKDNGNQQSINLISRKGILPEIDCFGNCYGVIRKWQSSESDKQQKRDT